MARLFKYVFLIGIVSNVFGSFAQDGEALYKNCFACHTLGKNSTGPDLVGVRKLWVDAGEADELIAWVKDANSVIASGKSKMADKIKDFSPVMMPPFKLSTEEVNAIFDYVDAWQPPAPKVAATATEGTPQQAGDVKYIPNYSTNLVIFYLLIALTVIILIAISLMSSSIAALTDSDKFRERVNRLLNGSGKMIAIIILSSLFFTSNTATAMSFSSTDAHAAGQPWLLIENQDIYFMLLIDIVLIGVVLYQRRLFSTLLGLASGRKSSYDDSKKEEH